MTLTDSITAHVAPRVVITRGESDERYYLTIGWGGYYMDQDVTTLYWKAIEGKDGAIHALKDMAHDFVIELARAIVKGEGLESLTPPAVPEDLTQEDADAVLEAELMLNNDDEGELH